MDGDPGHLRQNVHGAEPVVDALRYVAEHEVLQPRRRQFGRRDELERVRPNFADDVADRTVGDGDGGRNGGSVARLRIGHRAKVLARRQGMRTRVRMGF